ncbi:hypothetical protein DACRYDRAFT_44308, partial [Dacryopinax primogenitus]
NLQTTVGNISGLFQVHVATTLPVRLLLGRPFLTLFKCLTQDFEDGYQEITFTCPTKSKTAVVTTCLLNPHVSEDFQESRN